MRSVEYFEHVDDLRDESSWANHRIVMRRDFLTDIGVEEGEGAKVDSIFEAVEGCTCLGTRIAPASDVDVANVCAHASDTVCEDLHVAKITKAEVVVAIHDRSGFLQHLLASAEDSKTGVSLLDPFLCLAVPQFAGHHWSPGFVDLFLRHHLDGAVVFQEAGVYEVAYLWWEVHETKAGSWFQHKDAATFIWALRNDELQMYQWR